jgi:hypothetical protein
MVKEQISTSAGSSTVLPELSPCDLLIFLKLKISMKGSHFESPEDIPSNVSEVPKRLSESDFNKVYRHYRDFGVYEVGR